MIFEDRIDAGRRLAVKLKKYKDKGVLVEALPRGGVPVASEIARYLKGELDVLVVCKIGAPENPEFAIGAIAGGGAWYLDKLTIQKMGISREVIDELAKKDLTELIKRETKYREVVEKIPERGRIVILVDDGIATGATFMAGVRAVRKKQPKKIVIAVPVCPGSVVNDLSPLVDEFVCLSMPKDFSSVGAYYENFNEITDAEVSLMLAGRD